MLPKRSEKTYAHKALSVNIYGSSADYGHQLDTPQVSINPEMDKQVKGYSQDGTVPRSKSSELLIHTCVTFTSIGHTQVFNGGVK